MHSLARLALEKPWPTLDKPRPRGTVTPMIPFKSSVRSKASASDQANTHQGACAQHYQLGFIGKRSRLFLLDLERTHPGLELFVGKVRLLDKILVHNMTLTPRHFTLVLTKDLKPGEPIVLIHSLVTLLKMCAGVNDAHFFRANDSDAASFPRWCQGAAL